MYEYNFNFILYFYVIKKRFYFGLFYLETRAYFLVIIIKQIYFNSKILLEFQ